MFLIVLIMALNFAISWFNAWAVGKAWVETKAVGGWPRFMAWMGGIMSACGFTWVYLFILALLAQAFGRLGPEEINGMLSLGYLVIILPIIGSGLAITIDSWAHFWRRKSFGSGAVAGYNTFAQTYNTYQAIKTVPKAFEAVGGLFKGKGSRDGKGAAAVFILILVVLAICGGTLTTIAIVRATARNHAGSIASRFGNVTRRPAYQS
ncbi:MAG: hypothetical protein G01um101420_850 [Parcubacteria group bacterium Gr01-1014_20]|nr:MAG: hypothetical protein G01um101420_850 [Parcubacteria group bacterium Gr01-1014_20]